MPFFRLNMAALLRSATLLKFSPACRLVVSRATADGSLLFRLHGGATRVGGGVLHGPLASHRFVQHCAGIRHFSLAPEQQGTTRDDTRTFRPRPDRRSDWALDRLDNSVRRTGRITKNLLLRIFQDICGGYPTGNQALLLLRSCGTLLPEVPLEERTALAHQIWDKLQEMGVPFDASHYNALLKVYLQNEFKFSPTDFLAKMEAANVQPNRVTYQRLVAAYCEEGDIEGASNILGIMKNKDMPITEAVFNSLVTGHARARDMSSAENILPLMKGAGIDPGPDTYVALFSAYAEKGDVEKIKQTLEQLSSTDIQLMDRDYMQVVLSLTKAGHHQHVPEVAERMRHEQGFVPEAINTCLSLITRGQEDVAFMLLQDFPGRQNESPTAEPSTQGNFFLRHCVNMDKPLEKLVYFCKELERSQKHAAPLQFTLHCALEASKKDLALQLMKVMKEEGCPVREHFFWPLLAQHLQESNTTGIVQVLKAMQELCVDPSVDTYSMYVLPAFPNLDSTRTALSEAGLSLMSVGFRISEVRALARAGDLAALYSLLSSPAFPGINIGSFHTSVVQSFKRSDDVENMVKITELLHTDERFNQGGNNRRVDALYYFMYSLFDSMGPDEVQAKEEVLRQYLQKLHALDFKIPARFCIGIRNLLHSYNTPELIKDVVLLADGKETISLLARPAEVEISIDLLEKKLVELKEENMPIGPTLKQLILALCSEEKLERALELKAQYEADMVIGGYAALIQLCCNHNNVEEALSLKRELDRKDSSTLLTANKYLALVKVLSKNGRLEEAVDVLKEMKEKEVTMQDSSMLLFSVLNGVALRGDATAVKRLQDTLFSLGLAKPTAMLSGPIATVYLERGDLSGALDAILQFHRQYKQLPRLHDLLCRLVEKGETELLQKAMDYVSQEQGEMTMLYSLFFAFLQTGRYREARKIIETPGLRARPGRLQWFAEKCIAGNQTEALENLVEMTEKLFECDRDEMYHYLLRLCSDNHDWRKAETTWTRMQEENVIPRERTLRLLANILKNNGQEVPFEVPEMWFSDVSKDAQQNTRGPRGQRTKAADSNQEQRILNLCKNKEESSQELYMLVKEAEKVGVALSGSTYQTVIRSLLSKGSLEEALEIRNMAATLLPDFQLHDTANSLLVITQVKRGKVKDAQATLQAMLQAGQVPLQLAVTRLVQALGAAGDVEAIREVEALTSSAVEVSRMLYVNNTALAQIRNGNIQEAVEGVEALFVSGSENEGHVQPADITYVFRKVMEMKNGEALDKLCAMAERLANQFAAYRPVTSLFLLYLELGQVDEARHQLQRVPAIAEQNPMLTSFVARRAQKPGQTQNIKDLLELLPNAVEQNLVYIYLMKSYSHDKDLASAKRLHAQMEAQGAQADELTLKRLAALYKQAGEDVPFQEPPESFSFYAKKLQSQQAVKPEEE